MLHRARTWAHFALTIIILLSISVVFAQDAKPDAVGLRPDAPPYAVHGPYWVGVREVVIDEGAARPLRATIWYPALNPSGKAEDVELSFSGLSASGHGLLNADPDLANAPYPLVLLSHGNYASRLSSIYLCEHLASYGFVVIAVDHTGNTTANFGQNYFPYLVYRPQDITRAIDYAEKSLNQLVDMEHIAVSGHSLGGISALEAAGTQFNFATFDATFCKRVRAGESKDDLGICGVVAFQDKLAKLEKLDAVPKGMWPSLGDPRIDAVVAFAPGGGEAGLQMIAEESLQRMKMPALFIVGSGDTQALPKFNAYWAYDVFGGPNKSLVVLDGADHMIFSNDCRVVPWLVTQFNYYAGCSDTIWDMDRAHDLINHFTTAFLLDVLKGDKDAHKALTPDAVTFPGIKYKTTFQ